jgi:putative acetyltransferase
VTITVEPVPAPTREVEELLTELDEILGAAYAPEQRHALSIDRLFQPDIRFYVARLDGKAMGCGGVALLGDYAEVKRMYARETARGRGIGKALLASLEAEARNAGKSLLRLETGIHQTAAIALYERWVSGHADLLAITPSCRLMRLPPACFTKSRCG